MPQRVLLEEGNTRIVHNYGDLAREHAEPIHSHVEENGKQIAKIKADGTVIDGKLNKNAATMVQVKGTKTKLRRAEKKIAGHIRASGEQQAGSRLDPVRVESAVAGENVALTLKRLRRRSELDRLWSDRPAFATLFSASRQAYASRGKMTVDEDTRVFLDNVVARLVVQSNDLLLLCEMLDSERLAREFMRLYVRHDLADHDVLFGLVDSPTLFRSLPDDPEWMEVAVLLYGSAKLAQAEGGTVSISELAPLGLDVERSTVRSLVGSALDAGLLADEDREQLRKLFPGDAYFRAKLGGG